MTQEKIVSKLRKILSRTTSNHSGEAENAMLMAQRLLAEYGLTMKDVEDSPEQQAQEEIKQEEIEVGNYLWWYARLHNVLADSFRCYSFQTAYSGSSKRRYTFVGRETDTQVAKEVFLYAKAVIAKAIAPLYKEKRTPEANSYVTGFLVGLKDKFSEQCKALAIVKDEGVVSHYGDMSKGFSKARASSVERCGYGSYQKGYQDGKNFDGGIKLVD